MAELAIRVPIFIASPSEVYDERNAVTRVIHEASVAANRHGLLLDPVRYEDFSLPTFGRPQDQALAELRRAEICVFIFSESTGSPSGGPVSTETGTLEEMRVFLETLSAYGADAGFVYFRKGGSTTSPAGQLRTELTRRRACNICDFASAADLARDFRNHLDIWLTTWRDVPRICRFSIGHSTASPAPSDLLGEQLAHDLLTPLPPVAITQLFPLGRVMCLAYQNGRSLTDALQENHELLPTSWSEHSDALRSPEYACLLLAAGVLSFIYDGDTNGVNKRPYPNPVHQLTAALVEDREICIARLTQWLLGRNSTTRNQPIARNYAAYLLGMIRGAEAIDALIDALRNDPGRDVMLYAAAALGKIRARPALRAMVTAFNEATEDRLRTMIAQAIANTVGVISYEL